MLRNYLLLLLSLSILFPASAQVVKFPAQLPTTSDMLVAVDRAETDLVRDISASTLDIPVRSTARFAPYTLISIDDELIQICSVGATSLTACATGRGFAYTVAVGHLARRRVAANQTAYHYNLISKYLQAVMTALGPNLSNVAAAGGGATSLNNVGTGIGVYTGSLTGNAANLKTLRSTNALLGIVSNADGQHVDFTVNTAGISLGMSQVTGLDTALAGKAATAHPHGIADVTNLQTTLDGKAASVHPHAVSDVTNLQTLLDGKAASTHPHAISEVTDLQLNLDAKQVAAEKGQPGGYPSLGPDGKVPAAQLPDNTWAAIQAVPADPYTATLLQSTHLQGAAAVLTVYDQSGYLMWPNIQRDASGNFTVIFDSSDVGSTVKYVVRGAGGGSSSIGLTKTVPATPPYQISIGSAEHGQGTTPIGFAVYDASGYQMWPTIQIADPILITFDEVDAGTQVYIVITR